jgi:hypothetical protein
MALASSYLNRLDVSSQAQSGHVECARELAVTAVLFMIFLVARRSEVGPDHAAADTACAGTAHTAATTLTVVLAVAFLSGLNRW